MDSRVAALRRNVALVKFNAKGGRGIARCELCEFNPASDLHEIITRGRTIGNVAAREYSFAMEITSILCHECHLEWAHRDIVQVFLLNKNILRYGKLSVMDKYNIVSHSLKNELEDFDSYSELSKDSYDEIQVFHFMERCTFAPTIEQGAKFCGISIERFTSALMRLALEGE